ncbi:MAG TPA: hypothetical protein VFO94_10175, partial [Gammaproteobacteria bacterium]|nr:hypothetical protein [Gammaproteobacteria bacterium]
MFKQRQVLLSILASASLAGPASAQVLGGLGTAAGAGVGAGAGAAGNLATVSRDPSRMAGSSRVDALATGGARGRVGLGGAGDVR